MTIIPARDRHDLAALVEVREALERGESCRAEFARHLLQGKPAFVEFTPADLKAVYYKLIVSA
jgi:hypothetical protein